MTQGNRKTWISVLIASVIIVGMLAAAAIGGTAFFLYRHVHAQFTPTAKAEEEFTAARAQFAGQKPLIEMDRNREPIVNRDVIPASTTTATLETLRVLAYDTNAGKLVRVSIPFWLLRLAPGKHVSFMNGTGIDFDSDRVHLTLQDLERRGPGLILDQADRRGSQVLVWAE
jgi:hypothetical protein